jgi:predicted dehydrogenase
VRIALLGAGRIGELHGRLPAAQSDVSVIVRDVDAARAGDVAAATHGTVAATAAEALEQSDATVIAGVAAGRAPVEGRWGRRRYRWRTGVPR